MLSPLSAGTAQPAPALSPPTQARATAAQCRAWAFVLGAALLATFATGCQQNACNGQIYRPQKGSPVIHDVSLTQPLPENPWQVVLNMNFLDTGGDLGTGTAFVYLQGSPQVARSFSLESYFRASELPLDATSGTVALYMMLPPDAFPDATTVQLDLQVEDGSAPIPADFSATVTE